MVRVIPSPRIIPAAGFPPKQISEFIGREVSGTARVSVAMMKSPPGWSEPGQTPGFDEYSLVLSGSLVISTRSGEYTITAGQAVIAPAGEWVRYSSPDGADYVAICIPGFSPDLVHRDDDSHQVLPEERTDTLGIAYEEHGKDGIYLIEDLWCRLKEHHSRNARFFSEQLASRSFPERVDEILGANKERHLLVQIAHSDRLQKPVGFCVCSAAPGMQGEIESIYVEPAFRSRGVGTTFMNRACTWMKENGSGEMEVGVCEGNEESFRFYQRFGFYLRRYYLKRKDE